MTYKCAGCGKVITGTHNYVKDASGRMRRYHARCIPQRAKMGSGKHGIFLPADIFHEKHE